MVKVRISQDGEGRPKRKPESDVVIRETEEQPASKKEPKREPAGPKVGAWRGMSERQWFISLLVASGLLLLIAFRGCVLPSGVGPKPTSENEPRPKQEQPAANPSAKPESGGTYVVQPGDNLGKIAQKTGSSVDAIADANGISRTTILRVGQELKIP